METELREVQIAKQIGKRRRYGRGLQGYGRVARFESYTHKNLPVAAKFDKYWQIL